MPSKEFLNIISGVMFTLGFVPYIASILRGKTRPVLASWIIWATLDTITLFGMIAEDAPYGMILGAVSGAWIVAMLSLKYGKPGWNMVDKLSFAGAAAALVLWWMFDDPVLGIVTSLTVVVIGSFPTFVSAWEDPTREDTLAWTWIWLACIVGVLAIPGNPPRWLLADAAQPLAFLGIETVVVFILYFRPSMIRRQVVI